MRFNFLLNAATGLMDLYKIGVLKKRIPFSVNFVLTYRCNQNCLYCGCNNHKCGEMSTAEALRLISEMASAGTRRLGFTGGEPLLREDLEELIRTSAAKGITTTINSNGSLVPERIGALKELDFLVMTLDGPPEIHDAQRGAGNFEKVMAAIRSANRAGIKTWIVCVLTRLNVEHIDFVLRTAEEEGFEIYFNPVFEYRLAAEDAGKLAPENDEYEKTIKKILRKKMDSGPILNSPAAIKALLCLEKTPEICQAGRIFCTIAPDGRAFPCYPLLEDTEAPSALELGFPEAFNRIEKPHCLKCRCGSHLELNLLSSFNVETILSVTGTVLSSFKSTKRNPLPSRPGASSV